jgi:hypothetical protein
MYCVSVLLLRADQRHLRDRAQALEMPGDEDLVFYHQSRKYRYTEKKDIPFEALFGVGAMALAREGLDFHILREPPISANPNKYAMIRLLMIYTTLHWDVLALDTLPPRHCLVCIAQEISSFRRF